MGRLGRVPRGSTTPVPKWRGHRVTCLLYLLSQGIPPGWRALADKCRNAFLRVTGHHVLDHYSDGMIIGLRQAHFDLLIEGFLADADDVIRLCGNFASKFQGLGAFVAWFDDMIDEPHAQRVEPGDE